MVYDYSTSAAIDSVSSSENTDTNITIQIQGLDASSNIVIQTASLDATDAETRVALTTPLRRVFRAKNSSGTDLTGHVVIYENTALTAGVPTDKSKIRLVIQPENGQTEMALFTIPAGKTGYLRSWYTGTAGASKSSNYSMRLIAREPGGVWQLKHRSAISDTGTSYVQHNYFEPLKFNSGVDLEMRIEMFAVGATAASIAGGFDLLLVDD